MAHFETVLYFVAAVPHPNPQEGDNNLIAYHRAHTFWRPEPTSTVSTSQRRSLARQQQAFSQGQHQMANEPEDRLPENSLRFEAKYPFSSDGFFRRFERLTDEERLDKFDKVHNNPEGAHTEFELYVHEEVEFLLEEGGITLPPGFVREGLITTNHPNRRDYYVAPDFVRNVDGTKAIQGRFFVTDNLSPNAKAAADLASKEPGPELPFRRSVRITNSTNRDQRKVDSSVPASVIKNRIEAGRPREANAASYLSINWIDGPFIRLLRRAKRRIRFLRKGQILPSYYFESDMIRNINRHHWPLAKAANNPLRLRVRSTALGRAFAVAVIEAVTA